MLMEDSTTYQRVLKKGMEKGLSKGLSKGLNQGKVQGRKDLLLELGTERFGKPRARIAATIQEIADLASLKILEKRLLHASGWNDLLEGAS